MLCQQLDLQLPDVPLPLQTTGSPGGMSLPQLAAPLERLSLNLVKTLRISWLCKDNRFTGAPPYRQLRSTGQRLTLPREDARCRNLMERMGGEDRADMDHTTSGLKKGHSRCSATMTLMPEQEKLRLHGLRILARMIVKAHLQDRFVGH